MHPRFFFDFGSPYAYLAWQRIQQEPEAYGDVEYIPVSAAHIFRQDGSTPNTLLPNQKQYLYTDVRRIAASLQVPFAPPTDGATGAMPVRSIEAMRMHFAAADQGKDDAWRDAVFMGYFRDGQDISNPEVLTSLAMTIGLEDPLEAATGPRTKQALIDATSEAYRLGAPGVPYTVVGDEGFWGQDRLDFVKAALQA